MGNKYYHQADMFCKKMISRYSVTSIKDQRKNDICHRYICHDDNFVDFGSDADNDDDEDQAVDDDDDEEGDDDGDCNV